MIVRSGGGTVCRRARRADAFLERLLGLQFRRRFPASFDGLWFPRCRAVHTFFTFARPDLVFLDRRGRVTGVVPRVPAWRVSVGVPGTVDTLEIPGGVARRARLHPGSRLTITPE